MTYAEYLRVALDRLDTHPDERYGQAFFNALHEVRPDLANQVRGTDLDPFYAFYAPGKVPEFLAFVCSQWEPSSLSVPDFEAMAENASELERRRHSLTEDDDGS